MGACFYCGVDLSAIHNDEDHIYPRTLLRILTKAQRAKLPGNFNVKNKVRVCRSCNAYKGSLHPIDWLVIMPDSNRAYRLAERMVLMGENMAEVFGALQRRRR